MRYKFVIKDISNNSIFSSNISCYTACRAQELGLKFARLNHLKHFDLIVIPA